MSQPISVYSAKSLLEEENIVIKKFHENGDDYLYFMFKDKFTEDASLKVTSYWTDICSHDSFKKFIHIWDCQSMSGFDKKAKDIWMHNMKQHKSQTNRIILVSDNIMIRGAARLMSKFSKHKLVAYKTLSEMTGVEMALS